MYALTSWDSGYGGMWKGPWRLRVVATVGWQRLQGGGRHRGLYVLRVRCLLTAGLAKTPSSGLYRPTFNLYLRADTFQRWFLC